ncbi:transcriptional regulator, DeoR family [Oleidesulfovibrio alaskensis G20]|jgi:DeoR family glycerol-3-phosphate regulon repressor|uniref:Transcriptional regulator, DeoR family n=1 Tax=Oleidesulfovibrio alaskensis (strain ATCC BAA-1058 / DSM 17464 / G20) TaxID=207559 RepID=Q30UX2_OLEA2|nr:DeoR/GlpR family DNA-binding transcription regulator [Oleidesulfovibrio alaskensis]ABB40524.1 transcriptional regulator, DeoR family [Oleidesulfovibrio alaskensis G20]MBG0774571.1 DeoR/GlpR transcriptional regulator [Oleidesulfovibrio alaskensis]MBL3580985.1 DeoR/GlpR transcriptional regulator [Oleidesulfovibrio alaskensis]MBL3588019.1 DeoR/GlpR transcriptional regulator [bacterium]
MSKSAVRHKSLQEFLAERGYATIEELAVRFGVTPQTIRKDINTLAAEGRLQRFHGGAGVPLGSSNIVYDQRKSMFMDEKRRIGELVAQHIPEGASLCINIGTTTEAVARALLAHKGLRVVTNSLNVASILAQNSSHDVVVAGGTVRHRDNGIVGPSAERFIREFRVDYGIIGISGIDEDGNLLDYDYREVAVARTIIECSRHVYMVTDNSKFGRPAMVRMARLSDLTALFSNGPLPSPQWETLVKESGAELFLA